MPPKKAVEAVREASPIAGEDDAASKDSKKDTVNIEDYNLPKSIVTRLAKGVLPPNTQIAGNATLAITKGATVFVNYLASQANEISQRAGRKTINPLDVLQALEELEFPEFRPRLEAESQKYSEIQTEKRSAAKAKKSSTEKSATTVNPTTGEIESSAQAPATTESNIGEPLAKRARLDVDEAGEPDMDVEDTYIPDDLEKDVEEDPEDDVNDEDDDEEDTLEVDGDDVEEPDDGKEEEDEALDNGDDSD